MPKRRARGFARSRRGSSRQELANLAGTDVAHYGRIERGVGNPNMETLVRLAGALGVDPGDFLRGMTTDQLPPTKTTYSAADFIRERERRRAERRRRSIRG